MSDQKVNLLSGAGVLKQFQQSSVFKQLQENIHLLGSIQANAMENFRKSLMSEGVQRGLRVMRESQERMISILAETAEGMRKFKKGLPEQLQILAEHGWFIQGDYTSLSAIYPLAHLFRTGKVDEANRQMSKHIKEHIPSIEHSLTSEYPRRAVILRRAFDAIRAGDYVTSIPLLLMQSDGIGREVIAVNVKKFSVTSKNKEYEKHIKNFIDLTAKDSLYTGEIFEVILRNIPLKASEGDRELKPDILNRNAILHGMDTEYYTELNAMRAVSWIGYVAYFGDVARIRKS